MMRHFIRLVIAHEDLRLEIWGFHVDDLKKLDLVSKQFRMMYFVRRGLASVIEIEQAVFALNKTEAFQALKQHFSPKHLKKWNEAVVFFNKNHKTLNVRRGLYGGHIGDAAADAVIKALKESDDAVGSIQITKDAGSNTEQRIFRFAQEFVSSAMTADRGTESVETFIPAQFALLLQAMEFAADAVALVGEEYLFPHFGSARKV